MGFYDDLQQQYEEFAESYREQGIPLPSLNILIAAIVIIIAAAFLLIAQPFAPKTKSLEVTAFYNKAPIENAIIEVYDADRNLLMEDLTDKQGYVKLFDVPSKGIILRASKKGIGEKEKSFSSTPGSYEFELGNGTASNATKVEITLKVSDESSSKAVKDAMITYTIADQPGKVFKVSTDSSGAAKLQIPKEIAASLQILANDYEEKKVSVVGREQKEPVEIKLKKRLAGSSPTPTVTFQLQYATLRVSAKSSSGGVLNPQIELYDAETLSLLGTRTASAGRASFPSLLTGSKLFLRASLSGYSDYDGSLNVIEVGKQNEVEIIMQQGVASGSLMVRTIDDEGNLNPATLYLISGEEAVSKTSSRGETEYELSQLSSFDSFRFAAIAEGKLPALSDVIYSSGIPAAIEIPLLAASSDNSANLKIIPKDKYGKAIGDVKIKLFKGTEGLIWAATADGAQLLLEKSIAYSIIIESGSDKGMASVYLDGDRDLPVYLGVATEIVKATARNALTGDEVPATFYAMYGNSTFDSCFGVGCGLYVKSLLPTSIKVTATGYYPRTTIYSSSGQGSEFITDLVPLNIQGTLAKFEGIFDKNGQQVREVLPGETYSARLLLAASKAQKIGAYFRIGKYDSAEEDVSSIIGYGSTPSATTLLKGTSFSDASACDDQTAADGKYKWMNAEFENTEMQSVSFRFKLDAKAERDSSLPFYYRGYAVKNGEYLRQPADDSLKTAEKTDSIDWCKAKTADSSITIKKKGFYSCSTLGCLSLNLEQDGINGFKDFQARNAATCSDDANSLNSCENANMRISIEFYPNEAGKEFDLKVSQQNSKIRLSSYSVNSQTPETLGTTTLSIPLSSANGYSVEIDSLPNEAGAETLYAEIAEAVGDLTLRKSVSMKIYESCEDGQKNCGNNVCSLICIGDYYTDNDLDDDESGDAIEPECPSGQTYCADGVCRSSCEISSSGDFTDKATITYANGALKSSIPNLKLQIDAVMPLDAMPLEFISSDSGCSPLFKIISPTTQGCYQVENGYLIFRTKELAPTCPIKSMGDSLSGDKTAKLQVACTSESISAIDIPIEVKVNPVNIKSVQFQPRALSGSNAKVFHVLNQKQVPKQYTMEQLSPEFNYADAYTYAWSGGGVLELREDGERVDSIDYGYSESYFPNIDNQGGRVVSCSDYVCCTSKWCTPQAASQAFNKFKDTAKKVAAATVFRRGNNQLTSKILRKPFTFSTVIRLVQNANLPSGITAEDSPSNYGCENGNPKIYVVQAYTADNVNWKYTARIARLYQFNYIDNTGRCSESSTMQDLGPTDTHPAITGGSLALCNFLQGYKDCVVPDPTSSLASQEQVEKKKQLFPIPVPSTFVTAIIAGKACLAGVTAGVAAEYNLCVDVGCVPSQLAACTSACVAGTGAITVPTLGLTAPALVEACKDACYPEILAACLLECNGITAPSCLDGSWPINPDIPAILPFPRVTAEVCKPEPASLGKPSPPICTPFCVKQISYAHVFTLRKQLFAGLHVGIDKNCNPDLLGAGVVTGAFYATYKYPEYAKYANAIASGISAIAIGDYSTCTAMMIVARAAPDNYKIQLAAAACPLISQMFTKKDPFTGKARQPDTKVATRDWKNYKFNSYDSLKSGSTSTNAATSMNVDQCDITDISNAASQPQTIIVEGGVNHDANVALPDIGHPTPPQ